MNIRTMTQESIDHIIEWVRKEPWKHRWAEFQEATLREIAVRQNTTLEELKEAVSDGITPGTLFGVLFEHFMEIEFEDAPHNIVESYLQRRGWKESSYGKSYLQQLRETPFSLYEVLDVNPGKTVSVRDLIRPLPALEVIEIMGSQQISTLNYLMLKVVELNGQFYFSGAILLISASVITALVEQVKKSPQAHALSFTSENYPQEAKAIDSVLHASITDMLTVAFGEVLSPEPQLFNTEGHPILVTEIRFPVYDIERLIEILDTHPEFERADTEDEENPFWNWLLLQSQEEQQQLQLPEDGVMIKTDLLLPEGEIYSVRGNLELTSPDKLLCSLMSKERGEMLLSLLTSLLDESIGKPVTTYQSLEKMPSKSGGKLATSLALPLEETREILAEFLDQHYKGLLGTVIPILHGKTPREAVKTEEGKAAVVKWLRHLEEGQDKASAPDLPRYDFDWMWQTLGIEHLKYSTVR
jgi:hypothetical protein